MNAGRRSRALAGAVLVGIVALGPLVLSQGRVTAAATALYVVLAAVGLNYAVGLGGMPSLGQGAFVGIGAFGAALLRARLGWDPGSAAVAGAGMAAVAGALIGVGAVRLPPPFAAVATWLASWAVAFGLAAFPSLSGGSQGIVVPEGTFRSAFGGFGRLTPAIHYEIALLLVAIAVGAFAAIRRSPSGLTLAVARDAPSTATAMGVEPQRLQLGAFVASAAIGGLAGSLGVQLAGVADRSVVGPIASVELFVAVLIGGEGRALGPVIGSVVLAAIPPVARALGAAAGIGPERFEPVIAAALLLGALVFGRAGVLGLLARWRGRGAAGAGAGAQGASAGPRARSGRRRERRHQASTAPLLEGRDLAVRFGGIVALDGVSLGVSPGSIRALIGPNGSGKSTCLAVLAGAIAPDAGSVLLDGVDLAGTSARRRVELGVGRTLQRGEMAGTLTARDHALAGAWVRRRYGGAIRSAVATPLARAEAKALAAEADAILDLAGLSRVADLPASRLTGADQRLLLIAAALAPGPRVLLLDEPAAGMGQAAADRLVDLLDALRERGMAILIVEHDLRVVRAVADAVTVLDAGRVIAEGQPEEVAEDPEVVRAYLGPAVESMLGRGSLT